MTQYTLPQVWDGVKGQVDYAAKQKEVEEFNKSHAWLKRGVAVTPTRSPTLYSILLPFGFFALFSVLLMYPDNSIGPHLSSVCFAFHLLHSVMSSAQGQASPIHLTGRMQNKLSFSCGFDKVYCPIAFEIISNDVTSWLQLQNTPVCSSDHLKTQHNNPDGCCLSCLCPKSTINTPP